MKKDLYKGRVRTRLREIRHELRLSQADFAKLIGLSQSTVAQIEIGKKEPSLEALRRIADKLGTDPAELFASDHVLVFNLLHLKKRVRKPGDLTDSEHRALWEVIDFARKIGYLHKGQ